MIEEYERASARILGAAHAVGFGYARTALQAILHGIGARPGDEIVLSPLTCKVVPLALLALELRPVYADISPATLNLDADKAEAAITAATRAVLFQHTYGSPAGAEPIARLATRRGVALIEDCAQCLPLAGPAGVPGRLGLAAIFSNNLMKPLPAASGGLAVTADATLAAKITAYRDRLRGPGSSLATRCVTWAHHRLNRPSLYWPLLTAYRAVRASYRERPVAAQIDAEIVRHAQRIGPQHARQGLSWLDRIDAVAAHCRLCMQEYARLLDGTASIELPAAANGPAPLYYFPVLSRRKDALLERARTQRIEVIAWPVRTPIYPVESDAALPAYGYRPGSCPVAEAVSRTLIGLPTHLRIGERERRAIAELIARHAGAGVPATA